MSEKTKDMFLYWGSGSGPCWKPMLVLAEKGLWKDFPQKCIEFSKKEHKGAEIMALNRRGQVPTFNDGKTVINESGAICLYLEKKFSDIPNTLMPKDDFAESQVLQRMFETANIQNNVMTPIVYYKMLNQKDTWDEELLQKNVAKAKDELKFWEECLTKDEYLVGNQFTMADVFFYPFLATIVRQGATLADFPALKAYYDRVTARPSVQETLPPHWSEGPGPLFMKGYF